MSDNKPLPCPFCGKTGLNFSEGSTFRWLAYWCWGCGIGSETRMQTMGDGTLEEWRESAEQDAIAAWNTRAAPPAPDPWSAHPMQWWMDGADPLDTPLPCDVRVGNGTHRKGTTLRTLITRMKMLHEAAFGPEPSQAEKDANLAALRCVAPAVAELPALPEPTEAMIDAYLKANDTYWRAMDDLPSPIGKWRNGAVRDATKASLAAAIATDRAARVPVLTDEQIMRAVINACDSLNCTRVHELGGETRTIVNEAGLLEIARAVLAAAMQPAAPTAPAP